MKGSLVFRIVLVTILIAFVQNVSARTHYRIKRVSDQRLAEIETLLGLQKLKGQHNKHPPAYGLEIDRIGKRFPLNELQLNEKTPLAWGKSKRHVPADRGTGNDRLLLSDHKLAELETYRTIHKIGHGLVDINKYGRKRRSQSPLLDALFNNSLEDENVGDPYELNYEEIYKKR